MSDKVVFHSDDKVVNDKYEHEFFDEPLSDSTLSLKTLNES